MKFLFVTGGVVSSLGKGIFSSSVASILKSAGLKVTVVKMDPYLNVDAGTMSPAEHGEVFVTEDGGETDLDIGNYERFVGVKLQRNSNITSGKIWLEVLSNERAGKYLGKTVQIFPHIIENIIERLEKLSQGFDVTVVEVGGTVGDVESESFLHAISLMKSRLGRSNCLNAHLVLLPYLKHSGEMKTKPCQNSVKQLRQTGITPDLIIGRSEKPLMESVKEKIAYFSNIEPSMVFSNPDARTIYELPVLLEEQQLGVKLIQQFGLEGTPDLSNWKNLVTKFEDCEKEGTPVRLGLIAKYIDNLDSYRSVLESIQHGAFKHRVKISVEIIDSTGIEKDEEKLAKVRSLDCILVPGGFGERGTEGKMSAVTIAREEGIPFLGICYGMQLACLEYARNICKVPAFHEEIEPGHPAEQNIIHLMKEFVDRDGNAQTRDESSNKGGTLRLGSYKCQVEEGSLLHSLMGASEITERHRHRYEFNNSFAETLEKNGMRFSGKYDGPIKLMEVVELPEHPYFIATQYHPEFQSTPFEPHPLFAGLVEAGLKRCQARQ